MDLMEVCDVWLARDFLARAGRPLDIPPCNHPPAHCPPVKTDTKEPPMTITAPLHPDAVGFTLLRVLPNGGCRNYTAVEFERGWAGADHFLRTLRAIGYVVDSKDAPDGWHVLDVLNANGDLIQDYAVPPAPSRAMKFIIRKLGLRVERIEDVIAAARGAR